MLLIRLEAGQDILGILEPHASVLHRLAGAALGHKVGDTDCGLRNPDNTLGQGKARVGHAPNRASGLDRLVL